MALQVTAGSSYRSLQGVATSSALQLTSSSTPNFTDPTQLWNTLNYVAGTYNYTSSSADGHALYFLPNGSFTDPTSLHLVQTGPLVRALRRRSAQNTAASTELQGLALASADATWLSSALLLLPLSNHRPLQTTRW